MEEKRAGVHIAFFLSVFLLCVVLAPAALASSGEFMPGEVLVKYYPLASVSAIADVEARYGLALVSRIPHIHVVHYTLSVSSEVGELVAALSEEPAVEYAEPNYMHKVMGTALPPRFGAQWYLDNAGQVVNGLVGAPGAALIVLW